MAEADVINARNAIVHSGTAVENDARPGPIFGTI